MASTLFEKIWRDHVVTEQDGAALLWGQPVRQQQADIDGPLVATIIRERQRSGVTNATIKRDLGALSSVMNFSILQGWVESNPVLPKLKLVPERCDPIMIPSDRDIALVMERAPGMVGAMITAGLKTGARED